MKEKSYWYAFFYAGTAFLIFWLFKPKGGEVTSTTTAVPSSGNKNAAGKTETKKIPYPIYTDSDLAGNDKAPVGILLLKAYIDANNAGESKELFDAMKRDTSEEFGMYVEKVGDTIFVKDLEGNTVIQSPVKYS